MKETNIIQTCDEIRHFSSRHDALNKLKSLNEESQRDLVYQEILSFASKSENSAWCLTQLALKWDYQKALPQMLDWACSSFSFKKDIYETINGITGFGSADQDLWRALIELFDAEELISYEFSKQQLHMIIDVDGQRRQKVFIKIDNEFMIPRLCLSSYCGLADASHLSSMEAINLEIAPRRLEWSEFQGKYKVFLREEHEWLSIIGLSLTKTLMALAHGADDLEQQLTGIDLDWKIDHE